MKEPVSCSAASGVLADTKCKVCLVSTMLWTNVRWLSSRGATSQLWPVVFPRIASNQTLPASAEHIQIRSKWSQNRCRRSKTNTNEQAQEVSKIQVLDDPCLRLALEVDEASALSCHPPLASFPKGLRVEVTFIIHVRLISNIL